MLSIDRLIMVCEKYQTSLDSLVRGQDYKHVSMYIPEAIQERLQSGDEEERRRIYKYLEFYLEIQNSSANKQEE